MIFTAGFLIFQLDYFKKHMPMNLYKQKIISNIQTRLQDQVVFALIFGSLANNRFRNDSDIDLAVYHRNSCLSMRDKLNFKQQFSELASHELDIVFLNDCDLIIAMQVMANGELIINSDPGFFLNYKAMIISRYLDFKKSRKIIEDHMLNGRLYA